MDKELPALQAKVRAVLEKHYPAFAVDDFGHACYWKSLEEYQAGDVIEYEGSSWRVLYSWRWMVHAGIPVFMAELEPTGGPRWDRRISDSPARRSREEQ